MPPIGISKSDVNDPASLRLRLQQAHDRTFELLQKNSDLQKRIDQLEKDAVRRVDSLTPAEVAFVRSLSIGSGESLLPPQKALARRVTVLPPVAQADDGELVNFGGAVYRFDQPTQAWVLV